MTITVQAARYERSEYTHDPCGSRLAARLRRIDGQVHGLVRLLDSGRPAVEVLDQIAAVRGALLSLGVAIVARELDTCLHAARTGAPAHLDDPCATVRRLLRSA